MDVRPLTSHKLRMVCFLVALSACESDADERSRDGSADEPSATARDASNAAPEGSEGATAAQDATTGEPNTIPADAGSAAAEGSDDATTGQDGDDAGDDPQDAAVSPVSGPRTSCDRRKLTCRRAEPVCPEGKVAEIVGSCFGECVPIDACVCSEAAACPQPEQYTCHRSAMHCGPYVN